MVQPERTQVLQRMGMHTRLLKATDTHSERVTVIAFPRQKLLRERTSMLRHT